MPEDLKEDPVKFWNYFKEFKDAAGESRSNNLAQLALALYTFQTLKLSASFPQ